MSKSSRSRPPAIWTCAPPTPAMDAQKLATTLGRHAHGVGARPVGRGAAQKVRVRRKPDAYKQLKNYFVRAAPALLFPGFQ